MSGKFQTNAATIGAEAADQPEKYPRLVEVNDVDQLMNELSNKSLFSKNIDITLTLLDENFANLKAEMYIHSNNVNLKGLKSRLANCAVEISKDVTLPVIKVKSATLHSNGFNGTLVVDFIVDATQLM
jgi:hypothetical protein